jgi:hypothetical protein
VEVDGVRVVRAVLALLALVLALAAVLLALDIGSWRDALASGDRRLAANPVSQVDWTPSTILPGDPARRLVGLGDDIRLREAIRAFSVAQRTGRGFDNGQERSLRQAEAQGLLEGVVLSDSPTHVALADVLIGVLAFAKTSAPDGVTTPGARAIAAFTDAARLDPGDTAAKFDLELTLRALAPSGTRPGSNPSTGGTGQAHGGAGAGLPGNGF